MAFYLLLFMVYGALLLGGGLWLFVFGVCIVSVVALVVSCVLGVHFFLVRLWM